jgi:hypothetical protein
MECSGALGNTSASYRPFLKLLTQVILFGAVCKKELGQTRWTDGSESTLKLLLDTLVEMMEGFRWLVELLNYETGKKRKERKTVGPAECGRGESNPSNCFNFGEMNHVRFIPSFLPSLK